MTMEIPSAPSSCGLFELLKKNDATQLYAVYAGQDHDPSQRRQTRNNWDGMALCTGTREA